MGINRLYGDLGKVIAGQKFGLLDDTETIVAGEKIYPGDPIFQLIGDESVGYGAHVSSVKLTASAALVPGNSVSVTINGVTLSGIEFEDSSQNTMRKIVDVINLSEELRGIGITAFILEGVPLAFNLSGPGVTITASATVTGGASQPTFVSAANSTNARFRGVARHTELAYKEGTGFYPTGVGVNVMTRGQISVPCADSANPDNLKQAYVIMSGADAGKFTDVAAGNYDCGCYFRSSKIEDNLAFIEVRGIK